MSSFTTSINLFFGPPLSLPHQGSNHSILLPTYSPYLLSTCLYKSQPGSCSCLLSSVLSDHLLTIHNLPKLPENTQRSTSLFTSTTSSDYIVHLCAPASSGSLPHSILLYSYPESQSCPSHPNTPAPSCSLKSSPITALQLLGILCISSPESFLLHTILFPFVLISLFTFRTLPPSCLLLQSSSRCRHDGTA